MQSYKKLTSSILTASEMYGASKRLTTNPGESLQVMQVFPTRFPNSMAVEWVSSLVWGILITSSSFITGTGLKKCRPQNLSKRLVLEAISAIGMDEVLLEKIVDGFAN